MSDSWHMPLAMGVAALNALVLWLIAARFQNQVETIVSRHVAGLMATVLGRHDAAQASADDAKRAAFTVNTALHQVEKRVDNLEARMVRVERLEKEGREG
jgi:hypothetical protein